MVHWEGHATRNAHINYESPVYAGTEVMANVKSFVHVYNIHTRIYNTE